MSPLYLCRTPRSIIGTLLLLWASVLIGFAQGRNLVAFNNLGVRVAPGFRVTLYADSGLANDIYAMTLDSRGEVVVTSRGYIRTLLDTNGDGVADQTRDFARTGTGGMGMCFDGNDLYFTGDGYFSVYRDANGDGIADGSPQNILPLVYAEHGGHAPRKGPDGWWYVIGGNDAKIDQRHVTIPASPIKRPEAGALLRVWPTPSDGKIQSEVIADGFRNPYDFDFNWMGDVFTYDSDTERDYFLPWYTATRIYHVAHGGQHGWRLSGYQRSWNLPEYYLDTVSILSRLGRGSPTGVTTYRHFQFPQRYRGGMFVCDWTFGRIHFVPLNPNGTTYSTAHPEVFLEPIGNQGFAPTDIAVAPDGSMFVSIGGRRTRGAVYRIEFATPGRHAMLATDWMLAPTNSVDAVLAAPQPLDAWSRAWWMPRAQVLGPAHFADAAMNDRLPPGPRVRAIEILTEMFNGLSVGTARATANANSAFARARTAWSLGRLSNRQFAPLITQLASDSDPLVRRCALEALLDRAMDMTPAMIIDCTGPNLAHADRRVRYLAAAVISQLPQPAWEQFWREAKRADLQTRLTAALALAWRDPSAGGEVLDAALPALKQSTSSDLHLQALRLGILTMGDWNLEKPSVEVYTAYEPAQDVTGFTNLNQFAAASLQLLPSANGNVEMEAARVLAMVKSRSPEARRRVSAYLTEQSSPLSDFHYLIAFSRLEGSPQADLVPRIAYAILSLDRKLAGQQQRIKQTWTARLTELVDQLVKKEPGLGDALLTHPQFVRAAHVPLVKALGPQRQLVAARMFARQAQRDAKFEWSGPLVELLSALPVNEVRGLFHKQWENVALRDDLVKKLAEEPHPVDRDKYLVGLSSSQPAVALACARALAQLPLDKTGRGIAGAMRLLRRLMSEPKEAALRAEAIRLINHESGESFSIAEHGTSPDALKHSYQPVFDWFARKYPKVLAQLMTEETDDPAQWDLTLRSVIWQNGDPQRGARIFQQRGCQICHTGASALGPDLGGVAARFSPLDLFYAIVFPNRDVAPAYRTTTFHTRDGQSYTGLVVFEAADGYIIQTGATTTVRLATEEILSKQPSMLSLMPSGLLSGLQMTELADLYQYLKALPARN